jgi:hypothetical protein
MTPIILLIINVIAWVAMIKLSAAFPVIPINDNAAKVKNSYVPMYPGDEGMIVLNPVTIITKRIPDSVTGI